jgi:hypothetical protein
VKLRLAGLVARRKRRRRPPEQAPKEIVPQASKDPFDAARERLRRQIPPRED